VCSVLDWARWGLMALTGDPEGCPTAPSAPVAARVLALVTAIEVVTGRRGRPVRLDPAHLLAGRAELHGWSRRGTRSVNRTCRLLQAQDGWLAVSLSRPDDIDSVPALLGRQFQGSAWEALRQAAAGRTAAPLVATAQLLGIPAAVLGADSELAPVRITRLGDPAPIAKAPDVVLDLSAIWAGPLCAHILGRAGARVIKVEDVRRPDSARFGPAAFYAELHGGHDLQVLDFSTPSGRAELHRLADRATIVIESSRPRALRALGLVAEDWLRHKPGRTWVSVTGYGRDDPQQRVAFGDDAAVAGGLVAYPPPDPDRGAATPVFCADAIADPLTGMYAALAAAASRAGGGGHLIDVRMAGVSADLARPAEGADCPHRISPSGDGWSVSHGPETIDVQPQ